MTEDFKRQTIAGYVCCPRYPFMCIREFHRFVTSFVGAM